jgi:CBS domain-containing membrane protein
MSRDVVSIQPEASLQQAWDKLAHHKVKALPVIDAAGRLQGLVSLHDFFLPHHQTTEHRMQPGWMVRWPTS